MQNAPVWCLVIIPYAIDYKDGERGRNRTYNLLIKSQLLCQLSYAPAADKFVKTNLDYTIGVARLEIEKVRAEPDSGRKSKRIVEWKN